MVCTRLRGKHLGTRYSWKVSHVNSGKSLSPPNGGAQIPWFTQVLYYENGWIYTMKMQERLLQSCILLWGSIFCWIKELQACHIDDLRVNFPGGCPRYFLIGRLNARTVRKKVGAIVLSSCMCTLQRETTHVKWFWKDGVILLLRLFTNIQLNAAEYTRIFRQDGWYSNRVIQWNRCEDGAQISMTIRA